MKKNLSLSLVATFVIAALTYNVANAKTDQPLAIKDKNISATKAQEDNVRIFVNNQQRSLYQIALLSGVSVTELRELNKGEYDKVDIVKIGDSIVLPANSSLLPAEVKEVKQEDKHSYLPKLGPSDQVDLTSNDEVVDRHIATALQTLGQQDWENMSANKVKEDFKNQSQSYAENYVRSRVNSQLIDPIRSAAQDFLGRFGTAQLQFDVSDQAKLNNVNVKLFSPWYDSDNMLLFSQLTYQEYEQDRRIGNFGIGQRWDVADKSWLLGYNVFFDHDFTRNHNRLGLGLEAWADYMKFAANYYTPLSSWKDSKDFDDYLERAARGFDVRFQGYLPSYPHLGGSLMFEQYFGDKVALFGKDNLQKDPYAVTVGVDYTPVPLFTIKGEHKQGEGNSKMAKVELTMNYRIGVPVKDQLDPNMVDVARSLKGSRYDLVDRNNFIVLEYKEKKFGVELFLLGPDGKPTVKFYEDSIVPVKLAFRNAKGDVKIDWPTLDIVSNPSFGGDLCYGRPYSAPAGTVCNTAIGEVKWTSTALAPLTKSPAEHSNGWSVLVPKYIDSVTGNQNTITYQFTVHAEDSKKGTDDSEAQLQVMPYNRKVVLDTPASTSSEFTITGHLRDANNNYFHDNTVYNEYKGYVDRYTGNSNTFTQDIIDYLNQHWKATNGTSVGLMASGGICATEYTSCFQVESIAATTSGNQDDYVIAVSVGTVTTGTVDVQLQLGNYVISDKESIEINGQAAAIELYSGNTMVYRADNTNSFQFGGALTVGETYGVIVRNAAETDITSNVSVLMGLVGDNHTATNNNEYINLGTPDPTAVDSSGNPVYSVKDMFTVSVNNKAIADTHNNVPTNRSRVETTCGYEICYTVRGAKATGSLRASYVSADIANGTSDPHKGLQGNYALDNTVNPNGTGATATSHAGDQGYHLMVWVE